MNEKRMVEIAIKQFNSGLKPTEIEINPISAVKITVDVEKSKLIICLTNN